MEGMIIKLDSSACHLSMYQYCIVCINARLSWIPYANIFTMKSISKHNKGIHTNKNINRQMNKLSQFTSLNFEQIVSKFLCLNYKLDFEFGKDSWQILIKYVNNIGEFAPNSYRDHNDNNDVELELIGVKELLVPILTDTIDNGQLTNAEKSMVLKHNETFLAIPPIMKLTLGQQCCKNIDLFDLFRLYQVGSNKVILECPTIDWQRMIRLTNNVYTKSRVMSVLDDLNGILISVGDYGTALKLKKHRLKMGYYDNSNNSGNGGSSLNDFDTNNASFSLLKKRIRADNLFLLSKQGLLENVRFNMLPLKKCFKNGVMFGMNCNESSKLYSMVYQLLQSPLASVNTIMIMTSDNNTYDSIPTTISNYESIFEYGQSFYTAMLVLFFTQGTIFERSHHCYESGKDWIDYLQQYDDNFKNNFINSNNNNNNNNNNDDNAISTTSTSTIRDKIRQLFAAYIPKDIEIEQLEKDSDIKYNGVPIEAINICEPLKKAFGEYLFKRSYCYSLAIGALNRGANLQMSSDLLKQLNKNKSFKLKRNDDEHGKQIIDPTPEQLDLLTQFGKATVAPNSFTDLNSSILELKNNILEKVELIRFDTQDFQETKQASTISFYGELKNRDNTVFVAKIDVELLFDISRMFSNSVLPASNIRDNYGIDDDTVCIARCYLCCEKATKITLDEPINMNLNDVKNGKEIKMSWNVNHTYNIQNNINIGTANIEIELTFLHSFIQEIDEQEMVGSILCHVVYKDLALEIIEL